MKYNYETYAIELLARQNSTVLPRILQVLSRRSITLLELRTLPQRDDIVQLRLTVRAPEKWQVSLLGILSKLNDVIHVDPVTVSSHE